MAENDPGKSRLQEFRERISRLLPGTVNRESKSESDSDDSVKGKSRLQRERERRHSLSSSDSDNVRIEVDSEVMTKTGLGRAPSPVPPPSPFEQDELEFPEPDIVHQHQTLMTPAGREEEDEIRKSKRSKWERPKAKRSKWDDESSETIEELPAVIAPSGDNEEDFEPRSPITRRELGDDPFAKLAGLKSSGASSRVHVTKSSQSSMVQQPVRHQKPVAQKSQKQAEANSKDLSTDFKELLSALNDLRAVAILEEFHAIDDLKQLDRQANGGKFFAKCNELNKVFPDKQFHAKLAAVVKSAKDVQSCAAIFHNSSFTAKKDSVLRSKISKARHDFAIAKRELEKEISQLSSKTMTARR